MKEKEEIKSIEDLPGVGEKTAEKLREAGFDDLISLAVSSPQEVAELTGLPLGTVTKIIQAAREALHMDFITADELMKKEEEKGYITTGSKNLDTLLGGKGVHTMALTEFFGEFGSGKTQVGFQLAVNVQLPIEQGGLEGEVIWIDTEGTFSSKRIKQMAKALDLDPEKALRKIHYIRAYSVDHQMLIAEKIPEYVSKKNINLKLIVVDSLTSLFRAEYVGRGQLAERQQKLNKHVHQLQKLADRYNAAVYFTNQVMAKPDVLFGDPTAPIGGHVLAHAATYRVYLRKAKENKRIARLVDAPDLPPMEVIFRITDEGVRD